MAVGKCKECGGQVSSSAKACPHCGAKVPKKVGVLGWLFAIFVVLPLAWQFGSSTDPAPTASSRAVPTASSTPSDTTKSEPVSPWRLHAYTDAMTDKAYYTLRTRSNNGADFEFPYKVRGGSYLSLVFRMKDGDLDAFMIIDKGQMQCRVTSCKFSLKVGDGPVQTWTGLRSTTHESDIMFVRDARQLEQIVRRGEPIRIGIEFFRAGTHAFDFDVTDYPGFQ